MLRPVLALVFLASTSLAAPPPDVAGSWSGVMKVPGGELRLVVHLERDSEGRLSGTIDSPDQGVRGLVIAKAVYEGANLTLILNQPPARFVGTRKPDGSIHGQWHQGGAQLPLVLKRGKGKGFDRPQEPKPPFPYASEEVAFHNDDEGHLLGGA